MGTDANPFKHQHLGEVGAGDLLERVTQRMHVLSDPTRLRLLLALEEHEACVQQLADELGLVHRNVSHGLNLLYREGLLSRRREGTLVF